MSKANGTFIMREIKNITIGFTKNNEISWKDVENCETLILSGMDEHNLPFKIQFTIPPLPRGHKFKETERKNSILSNAKCHSCGLTIGLFITNMHNVGDMDIGEGVWQESSKIKTFDDLDVMALIPTCFEVKASSL